jgi:hypothetical protein
VHGQCQARPGAAVLRQGLDEILIALILILIPDPDP